MTCTLSYKVLPDIYKVREFLSPLLTNCHQLSGTLTGFRFTDHFIIEVLILSVLNITISLSYFVVCNHYGFTRFNVLSGVLLDGVTKLVQTLGL